MRSRLVACMLATTFVANASLAAETIVVGSKNFAESRFLGELFAQLVEEKTDLEVERRLGLVGTEFVFEALHVVAKPRRNWFVGCEAEAIPESPPGALSQDLFPGLARRHLEFRQVVVRRIHVQFEIAALGDLE